MLRLIQVSSPTCRPCKTARSFIENNYKNRDIGYYYVDAVIGPIPEEVRTVYEAHIGTISGVPTFLIANEKDEVIDRFTGMNVEKLNDYVYETLPKHKKENPSEYINEEGIEDNTEEE